MRDRLLPFRGRRRLLGVSSSSSGLLGACHRFVPLWHSDGEQNGADAFLCD